MFLKKISKYKNSLLFRLAITYTLTIAFLSIISFLILYNRIYSVTMNRMDDELLEEIEEYVAIKTENGLAGVKEKFGREAESEDPNEEFYRLLDFSGKTLAATDMSSWGSIDKNDAITRLQSDEIGYVFQTIAISGRDYKARMVSAAVGPDIILQIGETFEETEEYLDIFRNLFSILIITLIIVSTITGWYLARRALIGMEEVTQTAAEISKGSYDRRVQVKSQFNEIEKLSATFNKMLDRIQTLLRSMKEINDNIAHDLRSPLARIRGIAEMTLLTEKTIEDYKDMAVGTMEECDSLIDMINTMLDITEAEAGVNGAKAEKFELTLLILEACELFQPLADEKKIDLKVNLPSTLSFQGERKKMQRIVTNILENAIKYTPERGTVSVSAAAKSGEIQIDFEDTGPGISESDLQHIFERFYRCDRSRSQGGVGLGLSLAKAFTESMNGAISVISAVDQGSKFTVMFTQ